MKAAILPFPARIAEPCVKPRLRGYHVPYHGAATPCPGCAKSNWIVGRAMAECAFCETAIPIVGRDL